MKNNIISESLKKIYNKEPDSIAIETSNIKITYKKFYDDCVKFSNYILSKNFKIIAILDEKNYFNYVSIFGTFLAGKTYVPINKNLPTNKIKQILKIIKIDLVVASSNKKFKTKIKIVGENILSNKYFEKKNKKYQ